MRGFFVPDKPHPDPPLKKGGDIRLGAGSGD